MPRKPRRNGPGSTITRIRRREDAVAERRFLRFVEDLGAVPLFGWQAELLRTVRRKVSDAAAR